MNLDRVGPGTQVPDEVNVIIEIPANADPVKYEVDKETGAMFVDRFLNTAMRYPCNYGYVPRTLCEDGDPVDVLVVAPAPLISGSVIRSRPIGMLRMTDEKGPDSKILALPAPRQGGYYQNVESALELPKGLLETIAHFFEHYKDLESGKWVKLDGWTGPDDARNEINDSVERYLKQSNKPHF